MILKKKRENENRKKIDLDYRISGVELIRLLAYFSLFIMFVAWTSFILLSLLYLISFLSLISMMIYGAELSKRNERYGRWFILVLSGALLFFTMSISENRTIYLAGAYGSSLLSPLLTYIFLRNEVEKNDVVREVFTYG